MSYELPYICRLCKNFLEERNFTYAIDKRTGNPVLFCNPCREDGEKFGKKEITEKEFKRRIKKRWEEEDSKIKQKIEEFEKQGWIVERFITSGKSPENITCCQLVEWFGDLEEKQKKTYHSNFLVILNNLEKKGKLCPNCLKFRNNLQNKKLNDG